MKSNYEHLAKIASRDHKLILGLMSGTSMDGLDLALCRVSGQGMKTDVSIEAFRTIPHSAEYKNRVRRVFARSDATTKEIAILDQYIAEEMVEQIQDALRHWRVQPQDVDLIASHGQTVYHNPAARSSKSHEICSVTLQLGDGDFISQRSGIITISDFRQKNIAAGGNGAPLALYGDLFLFTHTEESRLLLNIGGIANFTWLPNSGSQTSPISTDTGPGNTLIDAYLQKHYNRPFDENAEVGRSGRVHHGLLNELLDDPFFGQPLPKTTGPELFNLNYLKRKLSLLDGSRIPEKDVVSTLHAFTVKSILGAIMPFLDKTTTIYVSGGGLHNPLIMTMLSDALPKGKITSMKETGIHPDAKEAVVFAILANECLFGHSEKYPLMGHNYPSISMGKVSFPW